MLVACCLFAGCIFPTILVLQWGCLFLDHECGWSFMLRMWVEDVAEPCTIGCWDFTVSLFWAQAMVLSSFRSASSCSLSDRFEFSSLTSRWSHTVRFHSSPYSEYLARAWSAEAGTSIVSLLLELLIETCTLICADGVTVLDEVPGELFPCKALKLPLSVSFKLKLARMSSASLPIAYMSVWFKLCSSLAESPDATWYHSNLLTQRGHVLEWPTSW